MTKVKRPIIKVGGGHGPIVGISGTTLGTPNWNSNLDRWEYPTPVKDSALRKQYKDVVNRYEEITRSGEEVELPEDLASVIFSNYNQNTVSGWCLGKSDDVTIVMGSGALDFMAGFNYECD